MSSGVPFGVSNEVCLLKQKVYSKEKKYVAKFETYFINNQTVKLQVEVKTNGCSFKTKNMDRDMNKL